MRRRRRAVVARLVHRRVPRDVRPVRLRREPELLDVVEGELRDRAEAAAFSTAVLRVRIARDEVLRRQHGGDAQLRVQRDV